MFYCLICQNPSYLKICLNCYKGFKLSEWSQCSRCGKSECLSHCGHLEEFTEVISFFELTASLSQILRLAKNKQDSLSQRILEILLKKSINKKIIQSLAEFNFTHAAIVPLKKDRVKNANWHTNLLLYKHLKKHNKNMTKGHLIFDLQNKSKTPSHVVILDDVLTKGLTLRETLQELSPLFPNAKWSAITLFRSHQ